MKKAWLVLWVLVSLLSLWLVTGCASDPAPVTATQPPVPSAFRSDALEKYVIIYGENNPEYMDLANQLSDRILEAYDVFPVTACDTDLPQSQYEIILGETNRADTVGRIMEYSVTVDGGRLLISAGGGFSARQAVDYLCQNLFTGQEFSLEPGEYNRADFHTSPQSLTEGTAARIMSANLLADAYADSAYESAHYRAEIFAGMLIAYTPDVLGLQETDEAWNTVLDGYLEKLQSQHGLTYARHLATYQDRVNYTSLLYRSDKFRVEDSGMHVFTWWNDPAFHHTSHMRNVSWARLSAADQPDRQFIVANTHWSYRTEHANGSTYLTDAQSPITENQLRLQCKEETSSFLTGLRQSHPQIPIFLTGDFNTSLPFFTESGWTPAGFRILSQEAVSCGKSISMVPTSGHFDHIFGSGSYEINLFGFFKNANQQALLTDHPFVYADLSF